MKKITYLDIFAGCGGLSLGLYQSDYQGVFAIEKNKDAFSTLKHNLITNHAHFDWPEWLPLCEHDINEILKKYTEQLSKLRGKIHVVAGGPPCQGFSMAGKRSPNDQRNKLVKSYVKFIRIIQPEAVIFENVHGFTVKFKQKNGKEKVYSNYIINALRRAGYKTAHRIITMSDFGVPQCRKRFILVAFKNHNPDDFFSALYNNRTDFLAKRNIDLPVTSKDAISDLEKKNGITKSPDTKNFFAGIYGDVNSNFQSLMRKNNFIEKEQAVDSHRFVNHSKEIIKLHKKLLEIDSIKGKRITPSDNIVEGLKRRGVTVLDPNKVAPTITSIPDELIHYNEPRILTVREYARIQSFPDWYQFKGKYTSGGKRRKLEVPRYTQVGNAVPPLFAEQLGYALKEVLQNGCKNIRPTVSN